MSAEKKAITDYPQYHALNDALRAEQAAMTLAMREVPASMLEQQADRTAYVDHMSLSPAFDEPLQAPHQAMWEDGYKTEVVVLDVTLSFGTPVGKCGLTILTPDGSLPAP